MYNAIFGTNPNADALLAAIGLTRDDVERFRDAYYAGNREVAVYTRCGGGNRECWRRDDLGIPQPCDCPGCWIEKVIPQHPLYLRDEDDDFDCTYATIYFRLPDSVPDGLWAEEEDRNTRWLVFLAALERLSPTRGG